MIKQDVLQHTELGEYQSRSVNSQETACSDENSKIYQTLLQSQLLGVENPHLVHGGLLNDNTHPSDSFVH